MSELQPNLRYLFISRPFPEPPEPPDVPDPDPDHPHPGRYEQALPFSNVVKDSLGRDPNYIHCQRPRSSTEMGYWTDVAISCPQVAGSINTNTGDNNIANSLNYSRLGSLLPWYATGESVPNVAEIDFRGRGIMDGFLVVHNCVKSREHIIKAVIEEFVNPGAGAAAAGAGAAAAGAGAAAISNPVVYTNVLDPATSAPTWAITGQPAPGGALLKQLDQQQDMEM